MDEDRGEPGSRASKVRLPLERDLFLRNLLRELSGTLEDVVGLEEASGFIGVVGQRVGAWIADAYRSELPGPWDKEQVAEVLVDLKRRIDGDFSIEAIEDDHMVLVNRACPFGDKVVGRPSLCMMTSNVFGHIAANNLGYARVALEETIARGAAGCRVVVHLRPSTDGARPGEIEYFAATDGHPDG